MALDIQYISLDVSKQPTPQQVRLGQGDANATQLVVAIFDEGVPYSLTNYSVRLSMRLPRNGGYYDVDGTKSGNVATFDIDESYAASSWGFDGFGYVDILSGETVICSTSRFQLVVLQNASDGVKLAPQYSDAIQDAIDRATAAAEAAEGVVLQDVPLMSATIRGGAQLGDGLSIVDGKLTAAAYDMPTMSANEKGGAKLGSGLSVASDVLSVNASSVDSGTLPISHGGTGLTSSPSMLVNLESTSAASVMAASPRPGVTGELPVANGGTGASTAANARANLSVLEYASGVFNVGGTNAYLLFTTAAIANFAPPTGVSACMVLDTSDNGLYWYTS